jgi:pyrophosphatase PpaX
MNHYYFTNRKIDTVLTDFDGTLMDTNDLVTESWRHTIKTLTGREVSESEVRRTLGEVITDSMARLLPDVPAEEALTVYRDYQRERYPDGIRVYEGAPETLALLKERGFRLGLVTSRLAPTTMQALDYFGLTAYFGAILTASDTDKFKPDPAPLLITLDRLGSRPEGAVMVGDTVHDIEAARAAGAVSILADWSEALPKEKRTGAAKPDLILKSWGELPELFA